MKDKLFLKLLPIKTERLIVRCTILEDVNLLLKMDKNEETQKFLGGIKKIEYDKRIWFIQKKIDKNRQGMIGMLTVTLNSTGEPIGFINLDIDHASNKAELSYIFDFDFCNNGYCTEVCNKIIKIGFEELNLNRIYAETIAGNIGSIRVLEKIGMKKEGERREHVFVETIGEYRSFIDYGILKREYK